MDRKLSHAINILADHDWSTKEIADALDISEQLVMALKMPKDMR